MESARDWSKNEPYLFWLLPCPSLSYFTRRHLGGATGIGGLSVHDNLCYFGLGVGFQHIVGKLLSKAFFLCI
jgi:hypothetical protein